MSALACFDFDGSALRVMDRAGEPWFVAADVCRVLSLDNNRQAVANLDADEKGVIINDTLGGKQNVSIISESGLYALIFKSRKLEAKRFRKWVTAVVLPAIRKTGTYSSAHTPCIGISEQTRQELSSKVEDIQGLLGWTMDKALDGAISMEKARVITSLGGRRLEAIRLAMELAGNGQPEQGKILASVA